MYIMETTRLVLRELRESDVPALTQMLGSPIVMARLFGGSPMDAGDSMEFIKNHFTFGKEVYGAGILCEKETKRFIGFAGLLPCRYLDEDDFELGFALREDSWGKGYATEIGLAQIAYGFENLCVKRLFALAHPQNAASLRALEKIGMKLLKTIDTDQRGPRCVYRINRNACNK